MYVTEEQIAAAKQIDLLTYLKRFEPNELVYDGGSRQQYHTKTHDSLKISNGKWHWCSQGVGGTTALQYLILVKDMKFVEAVLKLCNEIPENSPIIEKCPFVLPPKNSDYKRITAYLNKRGISKNVLAFCYKTNLLYESSDYHNCVFVGMDSAGIPRYAFLRGIGRNDFKLEVAGSDKKFNFFIPAKKSDDCDSVAVFESSIDLLSHMTLSEMKFIMQYDIHRICLGGTAPMALLQFLIEHPEVNKIFVCTDKDKAGEKAADNIYKLLVDKIYTYQDQAKYASFLQRLQERTFFVAYTPPQTQKDYNDQLITVNNISKSYQR